MDQEHVFVTAQPPKFPAASGALELAEAKLSPLRTVTDDVAILGPDIIFREDHKAIDMMKIRLNNR